MTHPLSSLNALGDQEIVLFAPSDQLCDYCGISPRRTTHGTARRITTHIAGRPTQVRWICLDATECQARGPIPTTVEGLLAKCAAKEILIADQTRELQRLRRRLARKTEEISTLTRELRAAQGDRP
jgi:septal ring factor EnvC (AmiA/AmiB activator)